MRCIPHPCARRDLLPPRWGSLLLPSSRHASRSTPLRFRMGLRNSPVLLFLEAFPVQLFSRTRMGRCVVPPIVHSLHKSARCERNGSDAGYCLLRVVALVERVRSASSVKHQRPPSKRDGDVACSGLSLPLHQPRMSPHLHRRTPHPPWLLIRCVFRDWPRRSHRREVVKLRASPSR